MKIKTSTLIDRPLDYAVAVCEGGTDFTFDGITWGFTLNGQIKVLAKGWAASMVFCPSTDWAQGGPVIKREQILFAGQDGAYFAWLSNRTKLDTSYTSPTHLTAAMRCYVASKLGDEVEIPEGLA